LNFKPLIQPQLSFSRFRSLRRGVCRFGSRRLPGARCAGGFACVGSSGCNRFSHRGDSGCAGDEGRQLSLRFGRAAALFEWTLFFTRAIFAGAIITRAIFAGPIITRTLNTRAVVTRAFLTGPVITGPIIARPIIARTFLTGTFLTGPVIARTIAVAVITAIVVAALL
jgi:hypothetical protein